MKLPGPIPRLAILLALFALTLSGCQPNSPGISIVTPNDDIQFDGLSQECFDSVVRIRNRQGTGCGSAVRYLRNNSPVDSIDEATHVEIETNRHVALDTGHQNVVDVWSGGTPVASERTTTHESWFENQVGKDIATIRVPLQQLGGPMPVVPTTPYGKMFVEPGGMVFSVGCSDGRHPRARCGSILKIENGLIYSLPVSIGGDSGGPLFAWSVDRQRFEAVGRTAWAIRTERGWVCLSMTSDRIHDIRSKRVSDQNWQLPEGAVPLSELGNICSTALPLGAIRCDELTNGCNCDRATPTNAEPELMEVVRRPGWLFPKDGEYTPPKPRIGKGVLFYRLVRITYVGAILIVLIVLYVGPTLLTPLSYNWPYLAAIKLWGLLKK